MKRRTFLGLAAGAAGLPVLPHIARAQTYPTRPITLLVGAAAGGPTDTIARNLAPFLRDSLGQPIVIEDNGVAAGTIIHARTARSAPDGYTLSLGHNGTHGANGAIYSLNYDVEKDFEPISLISKVPWLFVAKKELPPDNLSAFLTWVRANSDKALQGIASVGSPDHVAGVLLQSDMGIRWEFVPYRGSAPLMQDLVAGHVDWAIAVPDTSLPQMRAGNIKVFAVTAPARLAAAPEIPTVDEAGLPKFYLSLWHGLWARKGTPKDVVQKLNAAVVSTLAQPQVQQRLAEMGQEIFPRGQQTPEALAAMQRAEIEKWWPVIKAAGIKAE
jgi:tripartite-type tricarboxylate transporter receptor subunit TctC